jgi:hypothetical protein
MTKINKDTIRLSQETQLKIKQVKAALERLKCEGCAWKSKENCKECE